jgi:ubiquinone/menaquinone biosynthesis C-methylase UbiE
VPTAPKVRFRGRVFYPLIRELRGKILELGCAGGETLLEYDRQVDVYGVDVRATETIRLFRAIGKLRTYRPLHWAVADCGALPFNGASFDAVVGSFVFCSFAEPDRISEEIQRVLKHSGTLYLLEHVAPHNAVLRMPVQMASLVRESVLGRCSLTQKPRQILERTGWRVTYASSCGIMIPWEMVVAAKS